MATPTSSTDILEQAKSFLENPSSSLKSKLEFLESKGLSSEKILEVLKTASVAQNIPTTLNNKCVKGKFLYMSLLPWIATVGMGLATYYFTGDIGDECITNNNSIEIPSPTDEPTHNNTTVNNENEEETKLDNEPDWAKKLLQAFELLSEDVKKLKETAEKSDNNNNTNNDKVDKNNDIENNKPVIVSLTDCMSRMHDAIYRIRHFLLHTNRSSSSSTAASELQVLCKTLAMYLQTALDNPTVPRYRRISIENPNFKVAFGSIMRELVTPSPLLHQAETSGKAIQWSLCDELMASVGFLRRGNYYEWQWLALQGGSDSPEVTGRLPQYRFGAGLASRPTGDQQSTTNRNTEDERALLVPVPEDHIATAAVYACLALLNELKADPQASLARPLSDTELSLPPAITTPVVREAPFPLPLHVSYPLQPVSSSNAPATAGEAQNPVTTTPTPESASLSAPLPAAVESLISAPLPAPAEAQLPVNTGTAAAVAVPISFAEVCPHIQCTSV